MILHSDAPEFGGFDRLNPDTEYFSIDGTLKVYLPSRTALLFAL